MIFERAASDFMIQCASLAPEIVPAKTAFVGGSLPPSTQEGVPLRAWFFSEGQSTLQLASRNEGFWKIEIQILLRGSRGERKKSELAINALAELLHYGQGWATPAGVQYCAVVPSPFAPRPIDLGTDESGAEFVSWNCQIWQLLQG